ncbi:MAG: 4-(cytidine 5'-diphospho)-2-C-methyl-D-erythritol kinase [Magnetococcales bacterium]|nr:4-(cytidine 5'-diphospho)-2-C-methyl-D-erythritol kinase [Magnetococcales bacterium]
MTRRFRAPAKVNLSLEILGRREDGYHILDSIMAFFPWYDHLEVTCGGSAVTLECHPTVTVAAEENLVHRAAVGLKKKAGITTGVHLALFKEIPHGAGLGGGSSDAALTLLALNRMWQLNWSVDELSLLGVELGADVPFFLGGHAARVGGIGERITPLPGMREWELVVVHPGIMLATAAVYRGITPRMLAQWAQESTLQEEGPESPRWRFENHLEQIARTLTPLIEVVAQQLHAVGARSTLMSGSGSAVFGVFDHGDQAREAATQISRSHPEWRVRQGRTFTIHPFDREWQSGI